MGREKEIPDHVFYVCTGSSCKKEGGKTLSKFLRKIVKASGLKDKVEIIKTDCTDRCKCAPVVSLQPENYWMLESTEAKLEKVFKEKILDKS